jgi:two-component system sensor histidine kinase PilS (NtrC family)
MPQMVDCLLDCINANIKYPRKEITIESLAGEKVPLGVSTSILTEDCASKRGVIAIFSDLTEAKRLEAKIRHADRLAAVGELSASIAHEIRNPLASISGSVEVLSNELDLSDENEKLMNLIVKESHRLSKILSEFLTYARIDRPVYNKVELCHLIGEVIEIVYHHESFNDKINIRFDSAESIVYAVGDEDLLKQLLINLTVNACESFEGGEGNVWLRLILKESEGAVELYVEDNGPGIPPDVARKIYLPFYSTKKQGTGLGLSIVHRIVTALKIDLGLDSRPEQGTTFKLTLKTYSSDKNFDRDNKLSGESLTV